MKAKNIIIIIVIIVIMAVWFKSCHNISITRKPTLKEIVVDILERVGIIDGKVTNLAADVDTIKIDVRELENRKGPTIWRTKTVVVQQPSPSQGVTEQQVYFQTPSAPAEQPQRVVLPAPDAGTITPGDLPGPQDLLFCIDLEPAKTTDSSKKFLFWELVNGLGYQISNVVPNFTGKSANMRLTPGSSVDGITFDGTMLRMSVASVGNWYAQIMGVPMPSDFRPALRSNKSGWGNHLMTRSGDYFVYRF